MDPFATDPPGISSVRRGTSRPPPPPQGERGARHWLDLVHYAETNSYERDNPKPYVWRYRDYVIRAFNQDKPFDQFVREQLAGDELGRSDPDAIIATGFYRLGIWDDEPSDLVQAP